MSIEKKWIPCRECVSEPFPGYKKTIDSIGREILIECNCHKIWRETRELLYKLKEASLPFSDFILKYNPTTDYVGNIATAHDIKQVADTLSTDISSSHLIYFHGDVHTQKTTSAFWVGVELTRRGVSVYYTSMQKILEELITFFDEKKKSKKSFYEKISVLIIDDALSPKRISLFKNNTNYQLAPFGNLLRERLHSSPPRHTIVISNTLPGKISTAGFGEDLEKLISVQADILEFTDDQDKLKAMFSARKNIFGRNYNSDGE